MTLLAPQREQTRARCPDEEGYMGESLILAASHPERVAGLVLIAPPTSPHEVETTDYPFDEVLDTDERAGRRRTTTTGCATGVGWGLGTDAETILTGFRGWETKESTPEKTRELAARVHARCS